jgi:hypothetical protein
MTALDDFLAARNNGFGSLLSGGGFVPLPEITTGRELGAVTRPTAIAPPPRPELPPVGGNPNAPPVVPTPGVPGPGVNSGTDPFQFDLDFGPGDPRVDPFGPGFQDEVALSHLRGAQHPGMAAAMKLIAGLIPGGGPATGVGTALNTQTSFTEPGAQNIYEFAQFLSQNPQIATDEQRTLDAYTSGFSRVGDPVDTRAIIAGQEGARQEQQNPGPGVVPTQPFNIGAANEPVGASPITINDILAPGVLPGRVATPRQVETVQRAVRPMPAPAPAPRPAPQPAPAPSIPDPVAYSPNVAFSADFVAALPSYTFDIQAFQGAIS